jgi:hypothetical protein
MHSVFLYPNPNLLTVKKKEEKRVSAKPITNSRFVDAPDVLLKVHTVSLVKSLPMMLLVSEISSLHSTQLYYVSSKNSNRHCQVTSTCYWICNTGSTITPVGLMGP